MRKLQKEGYSNVLTRTHSELDLTRQSNVEEFFTVQMSEYVILAAAKVSGIMANILQPTKFLLTNLQIECNVINANFQNNVKGLLF